MCHSFLHGDELECLEHEAPGTSHRAPTDGVHLTHCAYKAFATKIRKANQKKTM